MGCNSSSSDMSREAPIANTSERTIPKSVPRSNTFEAVSVDPNAVTPFECPLAGNKKSHENSRSMNYIKVGSPHGTFTLQSI